MTTSSIPPNDPRAPKSLFMRLASRIAQTRVVAWFLVHVGNKIDPWLMRISGGRVNTTGTRHVLILHTVGAKSGQPRETPLGYFTDGDDVVLIASSGGATKHPAWLHNIRKTPEVELRAGGVGGRYLAREAAPGERERLWELATQLFAGFDRYQERTAGRQIPVVVCSPID